MSLGDYVSRLGGLAQTAVQQLGTAVPQAATTVVHAAPGPLQSTLDYLAGLNARAVALDAQVAALASQKQAAFNDLAGSWTSFYQGQWQPFYAQASDASSQMPDDQALSMGRGMEGQIQQWEARVANAQSASQQDVQVESYLTQLQAQVDQDDVAVRRLPDSIPGQQFTAFKGSWNDFLQNTWYGFMNGRGTMSPADKLAQGQSIAQQIGAWTTKIQQATALVAAAARNAARVPQSVPMPIRLPPMPAPPPPPPPPPGMVSGTNKGQQIQPPMPAHAQPAPAKSGGVSGGAVLGIAAVLSLIGAAVAFGKK